jgi:hypothetical protein
MLHLLHLPAGHVTSMAGAKGVMNIAAFAEQLS